MRAAAHRTVALGGTFDMVHRGHAELIRAAFDAASDLVIIGLASDELAARRGKAAARPYAERLRALHEHVRSAHAGRRYEVHRLDADFGPAALDGELGALIASAETAPRAAELNELRARRGLRAVEIIAVPLVLASDGGRISSTRIRRAEIDADGNVL